MQNMLSAKVEALVGPGARDKIKWLYEALSILDAKANGLLQINSLVMTIMSLVVTFARSAGGTLTVPIGFKSGLLLAFVVLSVSSVLCFFVVRIGWAFLMGANLENQTYDFKCEIAALSAVTNKRTLLFWGAWWLGLIGYVVAIGLAIYASVTV